MQPYAKLPMTAQEMLAEARRLTGIEVLDEEAREPLHVLVDSLNREGALSESGARAKHDYLMRFLKNRLRLQRDLAAHPEILDIELLPPVIINGMPRTGSTKLQKVLAATGVFNWLPMWMCMNPASWTGEPGEDTGPRIQDIENYITWFQEASPQAQSAHAIAADEPEEDSFLMMHSLVSQTLSGYANAPSYLAWYLDQNIALQFEYTRTMLKYLLWQGLADPQKPFVLKSAMSLGYEHALLEAHGPAHLLVTHRDPLQTVPSTCRLAELFRKPFSDAKVDHSGFLPGISGLMTAHMAFRETSEDVRLLDIDYRELRDDAPELVRKILEFSGDDADADADAMAVERVYNWDQQNPKNRHGAYRYTLEDFGYSTADVDEAFAEYLRFTAQRGIHFSRE
ncbi:MAG: sulfotransferase [Pseudomonadota bacterium]